MVPSQFPSGHASTHGFRRGPQTPPAKQSLSGGPPENVGRQKDVPTCPSLVCGNKSLTAGPVDNTDAGQLITQKRSDRHPKKVLPPQVVEYPIFPKGQPPPGRVEDKPVLEHAGSVVPPGAIPQPKATGVEQQQGSGVHRKMQSSAEQLAH